jgi:RNA polymerase-binding protein DksA
MKAEYRRSGDLARRLQGRRENLRARIRTLRSEHDDVAPAPGDAMDSAKSSADLEMRTSLIDCAEQELFQIDRALARASEGEYGICSDCGESIPLARLEAVPFTAYCVDCAASHASAVALPALSERALFKNWMPPPEAGERSQMTDDGAAISEGDIGGEPHSFDDKLAFEAEASEGHPMRKRQ